MAKGGIKWGPKAETSGVKSDVRVGRRRHFGRDLMAGVALVSLVACNGSTSAAVGSGPNVAAEPASVFEVPEDREEFVSLESGVERFTRVAAIKDLPQRVALAPATWVTKDGEVKAKARDKKLTKAERDANESKSFRYADILSQQLLNALVSTDYKVTSPLVVIDKMRELAIDPRERLSDEDAARLADALGVGAVLRPEITAREINLLFAGEIATEVAVDMIDAKGERLVGLRHEKARGEGTVPLSIVSAVLSAVSTNAMFNDRNRLLTVFELSYDLAEAMPTPAGADNKRVVRGVTHTAIGRAARRGEVIWFAAQTEREAQLYAYLDDDIRVPLEAEPSSIACQQSLNQDFLKPLKDLEERSKKPVYIGCYGLSDRDSFENRVISYKGFDAFGDPVDFADYANPLTVDTEAPDAPADVFATYADEKIFLSWSPAAASDLAGYQVFASDSARSGFAQVATIETEAFEAPADFDEERYYRVVAVDAAGNMSDPSGSARAVKVEAGPTSVAAGTIRVPTEWFAGASPYVLEGDVTIARGARLVIDPGTRIEAKPGARLIVEGTVEAEGRDTAPIQWGKAGDAPWGGIEVKLRGNMKMDHNVVTGAIVGLTIADADPSITNTQVSGNTTGVMMRDFANPQFEGNIIRQNQVGIQLVQVNASINNSTIIGNQLGIEAKESGALILGNDLTRNALTIRALEQGANTPPFADDNLWGCGDLAEIEAKMIEGVVIIAGIREADATACELQRKQELARSQAAARAAELAAAGAAEGATVATAATGPTTAQAAASSTELDPAATDPAPTEPETTDPADAEVAPADTPAVTPTPEAIKPEVQTKEVQPTAAEPETQQKPETQPEAKPEATKELSPAQRFMQGNELMRKGDYKGALDLLEPLGPLAPRNADLQNRIAVLRNTTGDTKGAIEAIERAIAANPTAVNYLLTAAKFHIQSGDKPSAFALLQQAEKLKPNDPNVQTLLRITKPRT